MGSGRDDAESVSEAMAQSGGKSSSAASASGCLIYPSMFFLFVATVIAVIVNGAWGG